MKVLTKGNGLQKLNSNDENAVLYRDKSSAMRVSFDDAYVKTSSPRSGRPLHLTRGISLTISNDSQPAPEALSSAFAVPETPLNASNLGKLHFKENPVFSGDETTRHEICQYSLAPWTYLLEIPGKNVRDLLIDAFNVWLQLNPENLAIIKQVVGYLHSASLIIDDIEDESLVRRGEPAAHIVFGIPRALNAGNYVYFLALEKLLTLQSPQVVEVFTAEMLNLHRGQGRDIYWRCDAKIVSEEEYCQMVCDKTGGLFRLAIRIMEELSPNEGFTQRKSTNIYQTELILLCDTLACYFQIRDDLINLASPKFHFNKGFCEDITEGKFSFIALHSLRTFQMNRKHEEFQQLLAILKEQTKDVKRIKEALEFMCKAGSFDYTINYLQKLSKKCCQ